MQSAEVGDFIGLLALRFGIAAVGSVKLLRVNAARKT